MAEDLALLARISQVGEHVQGLVRARAYLDAVSLPEGQEEMALDLSSLRQQLELDNVVQNPHLCPSLQALFAWFRSRYAKLYRERHLRHQREMAAVLRKIEQARPAVAALARLNTLRELGPPVSAHLPTEFARLASTLKCCLQEAAQGLDEAPRCALCGLGPEEQAPVAYVERLSAELERALGEQNRRLSAEAICQILAQSSEDLVDRFIKIVQASDLSALANILDDRLAGFLRDLLVGAPAPPVRPVLAELARRFPVVEEGEEEAVLAEFARLLEQAFAEARAEQPGPVRVALAAMKPERETTGA